MVSVPLESPANNCPAITLYSLTIVTPSPSDFKTSFFIPSSIDHIITFPPFVPAKTYLSSGPNETF